MNRLSEGRKKRIITRLLAILLLAIIILTTIIVPCSVLADSHYSEKSNFDLSKSSLLLPHVLWQYNVIVALNQQNCNGQNGLIFNGNASITINGGGALAFGCLQAEGLPIIIIEPPYKPISAGDLMLGNATWNPSPEYIPNQPHYLIDFTEQAQTACDQLTLFPARGEFQPTQEIISPGNYSSIVVTDSLTMLPGLYCLSGDFIVNSTATITGDGVTIFITGGDFMVNGNAEVHLTSPEEGILPDPLWYDLLLYVANDHAGTITLAGNTLSNYDGVIFAPVSNIVISGNPTYHTQLIGWNVQAGGTSDITLSVDFWPVFPKIHSRSANK